MFRFKTGLLDPEDKGPYDASKRRQPLAPRQSVTLRKAGILSSTAIRTSNLTPIALPSETSQRGYSRCSFSQETETRELRDCDWRELYRF